MTKIIINGAKGQMGRTLITCAQRSPALAIAGKIDLGDNLASVIDQADVVIDFSSHTGTASVAALCSEHHKGLVIGTTGHSDVERQEVLAFQSRVSMVWSSNYSTGVNALFWLTRRAVEILGDGFDLEVVEMHHRLKKDAPSGTAVTLAGILAEARHLQMKDAARYGRQGMTGQRSAMEIGIHAMRGGDVVGDHTVIFAADGERLELTHRAGNRETFAHGALRAAQWVVNRPPGLYDMQDVLGLK